MSSFDLFPSSLLCRSWYNGICFRNIFQFLLVLYFIFLSNTFILFNWRFVYFSVDFLEKFKIIIFINNFCFVRSLNFHLSYGIDWNNSYLTEWQWNYYLKDLNNFSYSWIFISCILIKFYHFMRFCGLSTFCHLDQ